MAFLELAENENYNSIAEGNVMDKYVFVPAGYRGATKDMYIREDLLDNMPEAIVSELDAFNVRGLSDKASRQARREQRKATRQTNKTERRTARAARQQSRQEALKSIVGTAADTVQNIFGTGDTTATDTTDMPNKSLFEKDLNFNVDLNETFWEKNRNWILPVGIGAVVLTGAYFLLGNKKKK
jgi:hypothetical protein